MKKQILTALIITGALSGARAAEFNGLAAATAAVLAEKTPAAPVPVPSVERLDIPAAGSPGRKTAGDPVEYGMRIWLEKDIYLKRTDARHVQFREKAKGRYGDICAIEAYMVVVDTSVPATVFMQGTLLNITRVYDRETYPETEGNGTEYQISSITVQISEDYISNMTASCRAKKGTRKIPPLSELETIFKEYFTVKR